MFKILVLQTLYTLSDDATEFQIRNRLSFMRFLDLGFEDAVPDAKTVWLFREHLTRACAIDDLFAAFDAWLRGKVLTRSRKWSSLRAWGMQVAKHRGMARARVAVARKLAVVLHRMWSDETEFRFGKAPAPAIAAAA